MRILGIDYGTRRIGLAVTDEDGLIAQPLMTLKNRGDEVAAIEIARWAQTHNVRCIVIGLPRRTDERASAMEARVRAFAEVLHRVSSLPVELFDERFTSAIAERVLLDADLSRRKRRARRDAIAAAIILQGYLEHHCNKMRNDEQM